MDDQAIRVPKDWVIEQLKSHNLDYDYKTDALRKEGLIVEESLAISLLRLDARKQEVEDIRSYTAGNYEVYGDRGVINNVGQTLGTWRKHREIRCARNGTVRVTYGWASLYNASGTKCMVQKNGVFVQERQRFLAQEDQGLCFLIHCRNT